MTNAQLIAKLRKAGKVEMPVLAGEDVAYILIQKSDLIHLLGCRLASAKAEWTIVKTHNGVTRLDVI